MIRKSGDRLSEKTMLKQNAQTTNKTRGRGHPPMAVRVEKNGSVWTVIHDRPEARNAMDPASADALTAAFLEFDADKSASVAVFYGAGGAFCAGWDLKYVSTLDAAHPLGELDIPDRAATAAKFRAARSDRRGSNWTSR
jgi:enoyl-CoA hydratase/carnithine racemase